MMNVRDAPAVMATRNCSTGTTGSSCSSPRSDDDATSFEYESGTGSNDDQSSSSSSSDRSSGDSVSSSDTGSDGGSISGRISVSGSRGAAKEIGATKYTSPKRWVTSTGDDPITTHPPHQNHTTASASSFIFSSLVAATVILRQRRHPRDDVTPDEEQEPCHSYRHHQHAHTTRHGCDPNKDRHRTLPVASSGSSQRRRHTNPDRTECWNCWTCDASSTSTCTSTGNQLPCRRLRRQLTSWCHNRTNINNIYTKNSKKNTNNNTYRKSANPNKRRRESHPTTIHEMATYLLGICMLTWIVVLVWNFRTDPASTITRKHRNDLPVRDRTRLRQGTPSRWSNHGHSHNEHHSKHNRDSGTGNWLVRLGLSINSFLFGAPKQYNMPLTPMKNKELFDSETLPRECQRAEWQTDNYPTCNDLMEIDLPNVVRIAPRKTYHDTGRLYHDSAAAAAAAAAAPTTYMGYVAQGYWRSVWAVPPPRRDTGGPKVVVLKTMRRSHELSTRNYDRHRRDAIVMEQLTSSPYVVNMYGFCGNSVLTEYMDLTLEDIAFDESQYPIIETDSGEEIVVTSDKRIQLALDMVRGVQAIHDIRGGPIVHADLQAKQFLISRQTGTVKINDFNRCRFMASKHINRTTHDERTTTGTGTTTGMELWNPMSNASTTIAKATVPCKFRIPSSPGISRSPEEYREEELDEKIDVYALGHVLYNLLSYREAWEGYHTVTAQQRMMNGEIPDMDVYIPNENQFNNHTTPQIHAISDLPLHIQEWYINVTKRAYTFRPNERASAAELAAELDAMLAEIQSNKTERQMI